MSESSGWKKALTNIIEELREWHYKKMLECLKKIPQSVKDDTPREKMPQTIIEHYGEEESITEIKRIMDEELPRKDAPIQDLLRPFVEKQGKKRKPGPESEEQQEFPSDLKKKPESDDDIRIGKKKKAGTHSPPEEKKRTSSDGFEKNNVVSNSDSSDDETQADDPGSPQSEKMTMEDFENQWRSNLSSILDELSDEEYEKLLFLHLKKIPGRMKDKYRGKMPQIIIQRYRLDESIKVISKAMDKIPRMDCTIQNLIKPMLLKLEALTQQDTNKMKSTGAAGGENVQSPGRPLKQKRQPSPQPKKISTPGLRKTIRDLKASGDLGQKFLTVKVVQKSKLCQYQIKANETKFRFYLGVADETDAIKVVVFGRERFPAIEAGHFYNIMDPLLDCQENDLKISERTRMSETGPFEVPRNVELEAEKLIFSPVYSIRDIESFGNKTPVSVEGTVKEIGVVKSIQMKAKRMKRDKQSFELEDNTGSIRVDLWGEDTKHLSGISNGDEVLVNNLKTNFYKDRVSLNSTDSTRITKVQSAPVQDVNITILGIGKFNRNNTELEVQIRNRVKMLEVSSLLLAKGVGLCLEDNFRARFVKKLNLKAKAQIQGDKINHLKVLA